MSVGSMWATAVWLIKRGDPVPADLIAKLQEAGYDYGAMLRRYSP